MSIHTALVKIEEQKISIEKAKDFISSGDYGAESIFIGRVRNENSGKKVTAVTYDAHDQAVLKSVITPLSLVGNLNVFLLFCIIAN